MPRYHFNVYDGITIMDQEGTQLDDLASARAEGMRVASTLLRREADEVHLGEDWRVEVTDGRGMILFRIDVVVHASAATA